LPGVSAFPITPPSLGQGFRSRPLEYVVQTSDSYANLARVAQQMLAEMGKNPGIVQPDIDLQLNKPELFVEVDRNRAADMGVNVDAVARTVETMLGGRAVTRYKRDADQYDVIVQTESRGRTAPEDIERLFVRGRNDTMVPLASLVTVREAVSPRELNHFNQRRSVTITANLAPGYSLGEALAFMDQTAAKLLPQGYVTELNGVSREFRSSSGALGLVFVLALLFIFLVLAAQFESFIDPFVILLAVPLSMVGALTGTEPGGRHAQRVLADRPHHPGGPDQQARHPDRRVQQPAASAGPGRDRGGARRRQPAPAPDPDDHRVPWCWARCHWRWPVALAPRAGSRSAG
jgi:multidrug efflux pump